MPRNVIMRRGLEVAWRTGAWRLESGGSRASRAIRDRGYLKARGLPGCGQESGVRRRLNIIVELVWKCIESLWQLDALFMNEYLNIKLIFMQLRRYKVWMLILFRCDCEDSSWTTGWPKSSRRRW